MKEVGRRTRRKTQLLDELRIRRRYWELKKEAEVQKGRNDSSSHEHWEENFYEMGVERVYIVYNDMDILAVGYSVVIT